MGSVEITEWLFRSDGGIKGAPTKTINKSFLNSGFKPVSFHFKISLHQDVSHPLIWSRSMCSGKFIFFFFYCPTALSESQKKWRRAPCCGWAAHKQLAANTKGCESLCSRERLQHSASTWELPGVPEVCQIILVSISAANVKLSANCFMLGLQMASCYTNIPTKIGQ